MKRFVFDVRFSMFDIRFHSQHRNTNIEQRKKKPSTHAIQREVDGFFRDSLNTQVYYLYSVRKVVDNFYQDLLLHQAYLNKILTFRNHGRIRPESKGPLFPLFLDRRNG
jgi:hypothetical protein